MGDDTKFKALADAKGDLRGTVILSSVGGVVEPVGAELEPARVLAEAAHCSR